MKVMLINGLEMRQIKEGDVLRCLTDEEPPFNNVKVGDKVRVRHINPFDEVMLECFDGALDWCNLGDLYLNFEHVNLV